MHTHTSGQKNTESGPVSHCSSINKVVYLSAQICSMALTVNVCVPVCVKLAVAADPVPESFV